MRSEPARCLGPPTHVYSDEDSLNDIAFDNGSGQQAIQFEDDLLQCVLERKMRPIETLHHHVEELVQPFHD